MESSGAVLPTPPPPRAHTQGTDEGLKAHLHAAGHSGSTAQPSPGTILALTSSNRSLQTAQQRQTREVASVRLLASVRLKLSSDRATVVWQGLLTLNQFCCTSSAGPSPLDQSPGHSQATSRQHAAQQLVTYRVALTSPTPSFVRLAAGQPVWASSATS